MNKIRIKTINLSSIIETFQSLKSIFESQNQKLIAIFKVIKLPKMKNNLTFI